MSIATASATTAPLLRMFRVNEYFFGKALEGISDEDLMRRPAENANPLLWVAGHVADTRITAVKALGEEFPNTWVDLFQRGCTIHEASAYPPVSEVVRVMTDVSVKIVALLPMITDEQLSSPAMDIGPPNCKTRTDEIAMFAWHDSYHIGQMALLRKALGYSALGG